MILIAAWIRRKGRRERKSSHSEESCSNLRSVRTVFGFSAAPAALFEDNSFSFIDIIDTAVIF